MNFTPMIAFTLVGLSMSACGGNIWDATDGTASGASGLSGDARSTNPQPVQEIALGLLVDDIECAVVHDLPTDNAMFMASGGRARQIRGDCGSLGIVDVDVSIYATIGYPQQCAQGQPVIPHDPSIDPNPPPMTIIQMHLAEDPSDFYNPPPRYTSISVDEAAGYSGSCSILGGPSADGPATSVAFTSTLVDAFGGDRAKLHRVSYRAASAP